MTYIALDPANAQGQEFIVMAYGDYDCFLSGHVADSTLQIERQVGTDWIPLDADGENVATWTSNGGGLVPLLTGVRYRVRRTGGAAGALLTIDPTTEYAAGQPNPVDA